MRERGRRGEKFGPRNRSTIKGQYGYRAYTGQKQPRITNHDRTLCFAYLQFQIPPGLLFHSVWPLFFRASRRSSRASSQLDPALLTLSSPGLRPNCWILCPMTKKKRYSRHSGRLLDISFSACRCHAVLGIRFSKIAPTWEPTW